MISVAAHYLRLASGFKSSNLAKRSIVSKSLVSTSTLSHAAEDIKRKIDVGENLHIRYKIVGNGPHVVLCLPGIVGSIESDYAPLIAELNKNENFTIVSWDPPGYGYSRPPKRDFSGDFYRKDAQVVSRLMEKLDFDRYSVLGWSNGGVTGANLAADFPDRITHLVTWGAHSFADERSSIFSKYMGNLDNWSDKMKSPMIKLYGEEYLQQVLIDWGNGVEEYHKAGRDADFKKALSHITCATLVIHGELDPVLGVDHAEFLHDNIKNSTLHVFPEGKHNLHLRFRDRFLNLVVPFLLKK